MAYASTYNQHLAYIAAPDPQDAATAGLHLVEANGSHQRRVTANPHLHALWWSPDSRLLAFTSQDDPAVARGARG